MSVALLGKENGNGQTLRHMWKRPDDGKQGKPLEHQDQARELSQPAAHTHAEERQGGSGNRLYQVHTLGQSGESDLKPSCPSSRQI